MGRTVINETENKQTVILNDSPEGVDGGYFDSEEVWHEFGGGGNILPKIALTVSNESTHTMYVQTYCTDEYCSLMLKDGLLNAQWNEEVPSNETKTVDIYQPNCYDTRLDIEDNPYSAYVFYKHVIDKLPLESWVPEYVFENLVNCTVSTSHESIDIIDPSSPASASVRVLEGEA